MFDREPVIVSKKKPTGATIYYPACGNWDCDNFEYDWEIIGPDDEDYPAVKREWEIFRYHQPEEEWRKKLHEERNRLSDGDPLWWGKPKEESK